MEPTAFVDGIPHGVNRRAVPFDARPAALSRPPTVTVHDNGDVSRHPIEVDQRFQFVVGQALEVQFHLGFGSVVWNG